ncbi:MAG TPA: phage scaffolding protein [Clostridia bacterium]|nr:phage scaffolding protein [Clostridia bacterium]
MSLTRKMLSAMGIEADKIDQIIEGHTDTVNGLKDEIATYKADAEKLPTVTKERDEWKKKHDDVLAKQPDAAKVQADFDKYKADIEAEKTNAKKRAALEAKLIAEGANPDAIELMLHGADLETVKLNEKGEAEEVDKAVEPIKTKFAKYFGEVTEQGAPRKTPPPGSPNPDYSKMSDEEYFAQAEAKQKG